MNIFMSILRRIILRKHECKLPKNYGIKSFEGIKRYKIYDINIQSYLRNFLNFGKKIKVSDYKICLVYSISNGYGYFNGVYHDAEYGFVLTKSGLKEKICIGKTALACIGFDCYSDDFITIKQIQGVSGKQNELNCFHWTKMLLKICVDWARDNGFKTVYVIRAKDSGWYRVDREKSMFMRYDVTARRSGFQFDEADKKYFLSL